MLKTETMHKSLYLFLFLLAACGGKEEVTTTTNTTEKAQFDAKTIVAIGRVEGAGRILSLAAAESGLVTAIAAEAGDSLGANGLLVQLDDAIEQAQWQQALADRKAQEARVKSAEQQRQEALSAQQLAEKQAAASQRLVQAGAESRLEAESQQTALLQAQNRSKVAEAALSEAKAALERAEAAAQLAEAQLQRRQLKAPKAGTLLHLDVRVGEAVQKLQAYAEFAPAGALSVRAEVDELFSNQLQTGLQVRVQETGTGKVLSTGKLQRISPYLRKKSLFSGLTGEQEDRRVREVEISLDQPGKLLLNSRVECIIELP